MREANRSNNLAVFETAFDLSVFPYANGEASLSGVNTLLGSYQRNTLLKRVKLLLLLTSLTGTLRTE